MKIVTFYSYKGGVGRSLLLANYAHFLCRAGRKVLAIDLDLEAPGLHFKFERHQDNIRYGVVDYVQHVLGSAGPRPISDYLIRVATSQNGLIELFPAGQAPSEEYNELLIDVLASQYSPVGRNLADVLGQLVSQIKRERPDIEFVLIDSRTGITETARFAVGEINPDLVVCILLRNDENRTGAGGVIRSLIANGISVLPVLGRVPMQPHKTEKDLLAQEKSLVIGPESGETGGKLLEFQILHADVHLPFREKLLWPSQSTLIDSALLYDYVQLFRVLDPEVFQTSPYSHLLDAFPDRTKLDEWNVWTLLERAAHNGTATDCEPQNINTIQYRLRERKGLSGAGDRPRFNYVPASFIVTATRFNALGEEICQDLRRTTLGEASELFTFKRDETGEFRYEQNINFDLLGVQMRQGIFEFCGEAYFLTGARTQSAAVLQFGWLRTFVCLVRPRTGLAARLGDLPSRASINLAIATIFNGTDAKRIEIGMLGDSSTTLEIAAYLTPYVQGERLSIQPGYDALAKWLFAGEAEGKERVALCDHSVAQRINAADPKTESATYSSFVLEFPRTSSDTQRGIPVGFLYPREDSAWRREISRAFSRQIETFREGGWEEIRNELKAVSIETFTYQEIRSYLVMDMTIEEAVGREQRRPQSVSNIA